jgi:plastocyanin
VTKWSHVKSNRPRGRAVSPAVHRNLLVAVVALVPALTYSNAPADGSFTAVDFAWRANGTDATTLTIAPGGTVTFGYPAGMSFHNLDFTGAKPSCVGISSAPLAKGWEGECTFDVPGTYPFKCDVHEQMTGSVVVEAAPTGTPIPAPTATADPAATPGATASPTPVPNAPPAQTTLAVKLAAKQRGTRVRGTVEVKQAASKLEVTVTARLKKARVRVGRWVKSSPASGRVAFSVPLDARARRALRSARKLTITVDVALTQPGGKRLTHSAKALIRPR